MARIGQSRLVVEFASAYNEWETPVAWTRDGSSPGILHSFPTLFARWLDSFRWRDSTQRISLALVGSQRNVRLRLSTSCTLPWYLWAAGGKLSCDYLSMWFRPGRARRDLRVVRIYLFFFLLQAVLGFGVSLECTKKTYRERHAWSIQAVNETRERREVIVGPGKEKREREREGEAETNSHCPWREFRRWGPRRASITCLSRLYHLCLPPPCPHTRTLRRGKESSCHVVLSWVYIQSFAPPGQRGSQSASFSFLQCIAVHQLHPLALLDIPRILRSLYAELLVVYPPLYSLRALALALGREWDVFSTRFLLIPFPALLLLSPPFHSFLPELVSIQLVVLKSIFLTSYSRFILYTLFFVGFALG